jgi:hypothetical protein
VGVFSTYGNFLIGNGLVRIGVTEAAQLMRIPLAYPMVSPPSVLFLITLVITLVIN